MGETVAPPKITLGGDGLRFLPPSARLWYHVHLLSLLSKTQNFSSLYRCLLLCSLYLLKVSLYIYLHIYTAIFTSLRIT